ncbi:hypothetical protein MHBO_003573 [Bonamia ostreae]|uniref:Uncharacterized protein n=1 Tax=Bonamia ostreae TaxID=126728 RepID=A0ABV2AQV9_9EUKA
MVQIKTRSSSNKPKISFVKKLKQKIIDFANFKKIVKKRKKLAKIGKKIDKKRKKIDKKLAKTDKIMGINIEGHKKIVAVLKLENEKTTLFELRKLLNEGFAKSTNHNTKKKLKNYSFLYPFPSLEVFPKNTENEVCAKNWMPIATITIEENRIKNRPSTRRIPLYQVLKSQSMLLNNLNL